MLSHYFARTPGSIQAHTRFTETTTHLVHPHQLLSRIFLILVQRRKPDSLGIFAHVPERPFNGIQVVCPDSDEPALTTQVHVQFILQVDKGFVCRLRDGLGEAEDGGCEIGPEGGCLEGLVRVWVLGVCGRKGGGGWGRGRSRGERLCRAVERFSSPCHDDADTIPYGTAIVMTTARPSLMRSQ